MKVLCAYCFGAIYTEMSNYQYYGRRFYHWIVGDNDSCWAKQLRKENSEKHETLAKGEAF